MRVPPILRNALFVVGMGLLTANYVHATAAVLTPAAGQAIQTTNGVRVASGVVRGGYVVGQAALYIAEFGGSVTLAVASRIAAGAVVAAAATAAVAPLVIGGLVLGAGAAAAADWLANAHAQGKALDYEIDPSGKLLKKGVTPTNWQGDIPLTTPLAGANTPAQYMAAHPIGAPPFTFLMYSQGCDKQGGGRGSHLIVAVDANGTGQMSFCNGVSGQPVPQPPGLTAPTTPTADQWEALAAQLATIPVNPKLLEQMGKPIPVDPVPVINPPDQTGAADVEIGATNPAPVLQGRAHTINGQSVPVPGTTPQQYTQPVWTVTPANDAANPYAVNVVVNNVTTGNPATPTNPTTPIPGTATPSTPDVCAQNPNAAMCQPVGTITDPSMPPIPELYVRQYPQGLAGIWQDKTAALTQTSLVTVLHQMMPTGITGGTCPSWTLNLSFGPDWADLGTHEVAPPCWLWDVAKAIMIISALMLARQLIFGG